MKHDDRVYLKHIRDAYRKIEEYIAGVDEAHFFRNTLIQDGAIRQLEIIGEAVRHISNRIRAICGYEFCAICGAVL